MALKREGAVLLIGIIALAVIVALLVLPEAVKAKPIHLLVRLFGLYGYIFLVVVLLS